MSGSTQGERKLSTPAENAMKKPIEVVDSITSTERV
jgi:hypothetical protein